MTVTKTIGGERLGSGNKMKVALRNYERSTHNVGYVWRSSVAPGVLIPFCKQLGLNGDSFEIALNTKVRTLPTLMPLFGTYKLQLDMFFAPIRLYQGLLHNNMTKIGMQMNNVKLPKIELPVPNVTTYDQIGIDNSVIQPTSLLKYLGLSGVGQTKTSLKRKFNAVPVLAYYDIFKNYYSNKQEENAYVVNTAQIERYWLQLTNTESGPNVIQETTRYIGNPDNQIQVMIDRDNASYATLIRAGESSENQREIKITGLPPKTPFSSEINKDSLFLILGTTTGDTIEDELIPDLFTISSKTGPYGNSGVNEKGELILRAKTLDALGEEELARLQGLNLIHTVNTKMGFQIRGFVQNLPAQKINDGLNINPFPLENIDKARQTILKNCELGDEVVITEGTANNIINWEPYLSLVETLSENKTLTKNTSPMNGLVTKTYLSDIFNNWVTTDWVDQINELTAVSTSGSSFTMESLYFKQKQYEILNAVAISGGTWEDWQEAIYGQDAVRRAEIPIYLGGMSSEIVFDEVVSNSASETTAAGEAPLGTLAGRGTETGRKGGNIRVRVDEPGYIIGILSITPRIDYSQGNDWDTVLDNIDDLHKPGLDQIGFQDLITEKMSAIENTENKTNSAGKQPAWIDYMTNYNKCFGDFAVENIAMAMTLNRRYEYEIGEDGFYHIKDLTSYIDPAKFNYAFADTTITSQNFWVQIAVNIEARRKMSAKIMPNL